MAVKKGTRVFALLLALLLAFFACGAQAASSAKSRKKNRNTPRPTAAVTAEPTAKPAENPADWFAEDPFAAPEAEDPVISPQGIADYLFTYGELPPNFITKKQAQALGWQTIYRTVAEAAPGMSIGGDRFGNYEGKLPRKHGRTWYEADCNYVRGNRGGERIVYSSDGLVFYTGDHYQTFEEMKPSKP